MNTIVTWEDFLKIDNYEMKNGKIKGKIREKIVDINKMLEIAKSWKKFNTIYKNSNKNLFIIWLYIKLVKYFLQ